MNAGPTSSSSAHAAEPAAVDKTSRESYDEFVATMDEVLASTGSPTGWSTEFGKPWGPETDAVLTARVCDGKNPENSPRRLELQVLGPAAADPEADRDNMIRYMEERGMRISGVFDREPGYPEHAAWTALGRGENGLEIDYGSGSLRRSVVLYGECSTHPSMQESVSRDTPAS